MAKNVLVVDDSSSVRQVVGILANEDTSIQTGGPIPAAPAIMQD